MLMHVREQMYKMDFHFIKKGVLTIPVSTAIKNKCLTANSQSKENKNKVEWKCKSCALDRQKIGGAVISCSLLKQNHANFCNF
jgi:hypothetical protein